MQPTTACCKCMLLHHRYHIFFSLLWFIKKNLNRSTVEKAEVNKACSSLVEHLTTKPKRTNMFVTGKNVLSLTLTTALSSVWNIKFGYAGHILRLCCGNGDSYCLPFLVINESCGMITHRLNGFNSPSILIQASLGRVLSLPHLGAEICHWYWNIPTLFCPQ